jgi:hypothetical protein
MTADPYEDLSAAARRRTVLWAVLRCLVSTTFLVVVYYVFPLDQPLDTGAVVRVLIGLAVFAVITAWQIRTIVGSPYPGMKAVEALGLLFPFYLLLFASTYFVMERASAATVFSTVGFGDIAPKSEPARVVLIVQMLGDLALLGAGARLLLGAVRRGKERRSDTGDDPGPAASPP